MTQIFQSGKLSDDALGMNDSLFFFVPTEKIGTCFCGQSLNLSHSSCSSESLYRSPGSSFRTYPAKVSSGVFLQACTEIDSQCCRSGPENGQYAGSDPAAEDLMDCTTITAEASRNIVVAAKAKDLNTSLLTSDKMKVRTSTI
jgi:hypothetical protein